MGISRPRDLDALHDGLTRWVRHWRPEAEDVRLAPLVQPATGLSSETIFVELDWDLGSAGADEDRHASWVVRLPPNDEGLFPSYDLGMQGRLQRVLAGAGVPAVTPLAVEEDDGWVGAPFLLMPRVAGRVVRADKPYLRSGWLAEATPEGQARLHHEVVDVLAQIHRLDWESLGCGDILSARTGRGSGGAADVGAGTAGAGTAAGGRLAPEVEHWARYLAWAGEGSAPAVFTEGLEWCRAHRARPRTPAVTAVGRRAARQRPRPRRPERVRRPRLRDGDDRAGRGRPGLVRRPPRHGRGPLRRGPPGVPRARRHHRLPTKRELGRPLADLRWYEAFAALRSGAILVRAAWLLSRLGIDDSWLTHENPTIDLLARLIAP